MLPARARLTSSAGFKAVYVRGRSYATDLIIVYVLRRAGGSRVRFGFSAGRKLGGAVQRNRAKRLMREAARTLLPQITGGWDIVVLGRRGIAQSAFTDVLADLENLLGRAGVLMDGG